MVVLKTPAKPSHYRVSALKPCRKPMITRCCTRSRTAFQTDGGNQTESISRNLAILPDLVLIDGAKAVHAAQTAMQEVGAEPTYRQLAKRTKRFLFPDTAPRSCYAQFSRFAAFTADAGRSAPFCRVLFTKVHKKRPLLRRWIIFPASGRNGTCPFETVRYRQRHQRGFSRSAADCSGLTPDLIEKLKEHLAKEIK